MPSTLTDLIDGLTTSVAIKAPCRAATTAAITLSGTQTIDGIAVAAGDRVLVKDQNDSSENGIWVVSSTAWSRAQDFDGNRDAAKGTKVLVTDGTDNGSLEFELTTSDPVTIGTSAITFTALGSGVVSSAMQDVTKQTTLSAARTALGAGTTGDAVFTASTEDDATAALGVRRQVNSAATYHVDGTNGDDTNDGLTSGTAFATIQKAVNTVCDGTISSTTVTIQVADGTYTENLKLRQYFGSGERGTATPIIKGNAANNTGVILTSTTGDTVTAVGVPSPWMLENTKIESTAGNGVVSDFGSRIYLKNPNFGACTSGNHMVAEWDGMIELVQSGYNITGGAATHATATRGGKVLMQSGGFTITLTGTPAFSSAFAHADTKGLVDFTLGTFSGTATGTQATFETDGRVLKADALPGDVVPSNSDYKEGEVLSASAVGLTTDSPTNIASFQLGAGEWDVWGDAAFQGGSTTTVKYVAVSVSTTTGTLANTAAEIDWRVTSGATVFANSDDISAKAGPARLKLTTATQVYMVVQAGFGVSTCSAYGKLRARRVQEY